MGCVRVLYMETLRLHTGLYKLESRVKNEYGGG